MKLFGGILPFIGFKSYEFTIDELEEGSEIRTFVEEIAAQVDYGEPLVIVDTFAVAWFNKAIIYTIKRRVAFNGQ